MPVSRFIIIPLRGMMRGDERTSLDGQKRAARDDIKF
jgi:hypothetical protein